jgi:hypothetical protein
MPKPKSLIGWFFVAAGILLDAAEHIDFINSHLPDKLKTAVNEPLILLAVVAGFLLVLIATREGRSVPISVAPGAVKRLNHNMQFTGAKYMPTGSNSGIVVACFQNKPIPHTALKTFRFGRVTVDFSHESGAAIGEISPAAWADSDTPTIDFEAGVTHCAAVAVFARGQWCGCQVASVETSWGEVGYSIERPPLPSGIVKAMVTLLGEMNVSLPPCHLTLNLKPDGTATVEIE